MAESTEIPTPSPIESKRITRRQALKTVAAGIVGGVAAKFGLGWAAEEALKKVGEDDQVIEIDGTKITYQEFRPEGKENVDQTKAVIYLAGFPWSAAEKPIHEFPQQLTNSFGIRGFIVDTKREIDSPDSLFKQADSLRKFFERMGVSEFSLVSQSMGAIKEAYFAENLERMGKKVNFVILANPRGLDKMGKWDLIKKFNQDVNEIGPEEREKNKQNKINITTSEADREVVQRGFLRSILRNVKYFGWQYAPLLWSQLKMMTEIDPIFGKIKAPILLFVSSQDQVSETEKYIPGQKVTAEQAGSTRAAMAQTTKGRERYLKEHTFTSAQDVKVLESSRIGDHLAIPGPRAKQAAHISSKYLARSRK